MCPIEGLSETRRITRLGKIHLGIKRISEKTGKEYPSATDYFVCPPEITEVYGEKPVKLDIMFPLEDEEVIAHQYLKCYSSFRGLTCKGTGKTCRRLIDTKTGDFANRESKPENLVWKERLPCKPDECPKYKAGDCREIMNLQFMLPKVPGIGIWQLDTSSINSIIQVNSALALIKGLTKKMGGTLAFTPLELVIVEKEAAPDGVKKKIQTLDIVYRGSYAKLKAATRSPLEIEMPPPDEEKPDLLFPENEETMSDKEADALFDKKQPPQVIVKPADKPPVPKPAEKPAPVVETAAQPIDNGMYGFVERAYLDESLRNPKLKKCWPATQMMTWLRNHSAGAATIQAGAAKLNETDAASFCKEIQDRMAMA